MKNSQKVSCIVLLAISAMAITGKAVISELDNADLVRVSGMSCLTCCCWKAGNGANCNPGQNAVVPNGESDDCGNYIYSNGLCISSVGGNGHYSLPNGVPHPDDITTNVDGGGHPITGKTAVLETGPCIIITRYECIVDIDPTTGRPKPNCKRGSSQDTNYGTKQRGSCDGC